MLYGSLVTTAIALSIGVPISIGVAVFLSEVSPPRLRSPLSFVVEMLAAVPSVVYGLWGLFILAPLLRDYAYRFLQEYLGFLPIFQGTIYGESILTAGIILAVMIIPIVSSISRDALMAVPDSQREAAYALGATKSEAVRISVLSYARSGILASIFLGLGRAFGETIAVTMVVGNTPLISRSLFSPGYTLASLIANEFTEATTTVYVSALVEAGLVLLVVVFLTNIAARLLIRRLLRSREAASYL
jgi:phosphate transport system permease protein